MGGDDAARRDRERTTEERGALGGRLEGHSFVPTGLVDGDRDDAGGWRAHLSVVSRDRRAREVTSRALSGYLRLAWVLALGVGIVVAHDWADPRRQVDLRRFLTETPLAVALGIGVVGVAVRTVRGDPATPSVGAVVRTTVLLAFMLVVFALVGPAGVV